MSGTALTSKSDGVSCVSVASSGEMIVYGGASADRVWCLDTASMQWRAAVCRGEVPQARKWHSAVEHAGEMFVFGGETANGADDGLYSLGLADGADRFVWECIHTLGPCPSARSHHTAAVQDGYMYVFGGKVSEQPTVAAHRHMVAAGFYDAYRIHLDSCVWERLAPPPLAAPPRLWGHSATNFRHFILYYGGFELAVEEGGPRGVSSLGDMQPPTAHLNEVVHIYNTHKKEWTRSTPKGTVRPPPRALHNAVSLGSEMFVFGGIGLDHASRTVPVNDFWSWDVATGRWTHLPFCLKHWKSARLLHSLQHCFLYVLSDLSVAHRLDLRVKKAWTPARCDVSGLAQAQAADAAGGGGGAATGRARRRRNLAVEGRRREEVAYEEQQRAILRDELGQRLREELESADGLAKATHVEMLQRQIGALRGQMEELTVLQRTQAQEIARARPEQLPQLLRQGSPRLRRDRGAGASPQRAAAAAAAAATPVGSPASRDANPAADAALASQVSKLVDAVSRLKAIGTEQQAPPPSAAAVATGVAASPDPHAVAHLQQQQQQHPVPPHYYHPGAVPLQQAPPQPAAAPVPLQGYYSPPRDNSFGVGAPQNVQDLTWLQQQMARPSVLQQQMGGGGGGGGNSAAAAPSPSPSQQYSASPSIAPWPAAAAVGAYPMAPQQQQQQHLAGALPLQQQQQQQHSLSAHQYVPPPPPPYAHPSQVAAGYQQFPPPPPPHTPPSAPYQPSVSAGGGSGVVSDSRQPPLQRSDHLLELQKHLEYIEATAEVVR